VIGNGSGVEFGFQGNAHPIGIRRIRQSPPRLALVDRLDLSHIPPDVSERIAYTLPERTVEIRLP